MNDSPFYHFLLSHCTVGSIDDRIILKHPGDLSSLPSVRLDFSTFDSATQNSLVNPPEHFNGTLKEY